MQKIILNHAQLVSLASGFPLKWPDEVESMFTYMGMLAQASSYAFNPACSSGKKGGPFPPLPYPFSKTPGTTIPMPAFYQKAIAMQLMPFIACAFACVFWTLVALRDCVDPPVKRLARHKKQKKLRHEKKKIKAAKKNHKKAEKIRKKEKAREAKRLKKLSAASTKKAMTKVTPVAPTNTTGKKKVATAKNKKKIDTAKKVVKDKDKTTTKMVDTKDPTNTVVQEYQKTAARPKRPVRNKKTNNTTVVPAAAVADGSAPVLDEHAKKNTVEKEVTETKETKVITTDASSNAASKSNAKSDAKEDTIQIATKVDINSSETKKVRPARPKRTLSKKKSKAKEPESKADQADITQHQEDLHGMLYADASNLDIKVDKSDVEFSPKKSKSLKDQMSGMFHGHGHHNDVPKNRRKSMKDKIKNNMALQSKINKSGVGKFDKFCATIVTLMYLCYPVLIKSTFQLVACMPIGKNSYLQRDLNIRCWDTDDKGSLTGVHVMFVLYLFIPGAILWVIGMPLLTYIVLSKNEATLYNKTMKFRMGTLYVGYTASCYYWESVISVRKCLVLAASVFLVAYGAETQALAGMMICMIFLIFHLHWKPFIKVAPGRNTLFWAEFWALFVAFLTFWTGLMFFQAEKPWWSEDVSRGFAIELISVNVMYMILSMRWYMILKLMDTADLIMTKELEGADEKELKGAKKSANFLRMFVPEWKVIQNLWAKKAWQSTIRHQIMANRSLRAMGALNSLQHGKGAENFVKGHQGHHKAKNAFSTASQRAMHDEAMAALGLGTHIAERKKQAEQKVKEAARRAKRDRRRKKMKGMFSMKKKKKDVPLKTDHMKGPMEVMADAADALRLEKIRHQHQKEAKQNVKDMLQKDMELHEKRLSSSGGPPLAAKTKIVEIASKKDEETVKTKIVEIASKKDEETKSGPSRLTKGASKSNLAAPSTGIETKAPNSPARPARPTKGSPKSNLAPPGTGPSSPPRPSRPARPARPSKTKKKDG